jgi:anti-sigma regulatory factor (Ser/Thr protein kinase)
VFAVVILQRMPLTSAQCHPPAGTPPRLLLDSHPEAVRHAREYAREFVSSLVPDIPDGPLDDVVTLVSELTTNAIRYGTEPGDSVLVVLDAVPGRVRVEVHDPTRRRPHQRPESDERGRGRGLFIVEALATQWGVDERPFGKAVWAVVAW